VTLETAQILLGLILETVLLAILLWRRVYATHPCFLINLAVGLVLDSIWFFLVHYAPQQELAFWAVQISVTLINTAAVLLEAAHTLQTNNPGKRPQSFLGIFFFLVAGFAIWLLSPWTPPSNITLLALFAVRMNQAFAISLLAGILGLVWWSNVEKLRWPSRTMHIINGLAFYAVIAVAVHLIHIHQALGPAYHIADQIAAASYLGSLSYWIYYFA
jgi:hypothetical protein